MKRAKNFDDRLLAVASLVREGAVLADVGTDHAYLPIALLSGGRIKSAIASDIHEGPIANAAANIEKAGFSDKITTVRCDGLAPLASHHPTDIVIAGMGGMLIVEILQAAAFIFDNRLRLILQPMRDASAVRAFLAEHGFAIVAEKLCVADDKLYQVIAAEYCGRPYTLTSIERLLGPRLLEARLDPLFERHLQKEHCALSIRLAGLAAAGRPDPHLSATLSELEKLKTEAASVK